ncbi:MAG: hypothetical protein K8F52_08110 [Candidatus Scalindua rubra]|uniref:Uncharacterized protein n=1 Tax=Candidatus Scalindua brodae TaxID=237368 RepID=A0A0B0ENH4_9BACT|nr:MAG: hypothetical protein SCABRO_00058 [Candidatus Scalindua brodae]MBZ0108621.1 hypothetical protein [Candidatus Scalindua rubra]TWU38192.1 hypothetical protein S225a_02390 [Candidatus Brocadiaceae bacterium S225]
MGMVDGVDIRKLNLALADLMDIYHGVPLSELRIGPLLVDIVKLVSQYKVKIPSDPFLLAKTMSIQRDYCGFGYRFVNNNADR